LSTKLQIILLADHKFGGRQIFSFLAADGWPNFFWQIFGLTFFAAVVAKFGG